MRDFVTSFLENPIKEYHKSYMFRTPLNPPLRCAQSQSKGQRLVATLPVRCAGMFLEVRGVIIFERTGEVQEHSSRLCIAANGGLHQPR